MPAIIIKLCFTLIVRTATSARCVISSGCSKSTTNLNNLCGCDSSRIGSHWKSAPSFVLLSAQPNTNDFVHSYLYCTHFRYVSIENPNYLKIKKKKPKMKSVSFSTHFCSTQNSNLNEFLSISNELLYLMYESFHAIRTQYLLYCIHA